MNGWQIWLLARVAFDIVRLADKGGFTDKDKVRRQGHVKLAETLKRLGFTLGFSAFGQSLGRQTDGFEETTTTATEGFEAISVEASVLEYVW